MIGMNEWKELPSTTITEHWVALEISFYYRLDHDFHELILKLRGKIELRVKHILQLNHFDAINIVWSTNNINLLYTLAMLSKVKTRFPFRHKFVIYFFLNSNYRSSSHLWILMSVKRKFPYFKSMKLRCFHLLFNWKWLIFNVMVS